MTTKSPLLFLILISTAACGTDGGLGTVLSGQDTLHTLDGIWIQQRSQCNGSEVTPAPGESTSMSIAGRQATISNSFDYGGGVVCNVRTPAQVQYESENSVLFTFQQSACSAGCPEAMCAALLGYVPPPSTFAYVLNEPNLKLTTNDGSTFGCTKNNPFEVEFARQ
ncbi:MAG TPA: hypothetical protein VFV50_05075 [Bdellovibrionales bacterium]|nr:hypothetical protein [Bdellovibrionales bacterium]